LGATLGQVTGLIVVGSVSLHSVEHWGRIVRGGFSESQKDLLPYEGLLKK
jgi:hypothetical protein